MRDRTHTHWRPACQAAKGCRIYGQWQPSGNFKELEIKYNEIEKKETDQKIFTEFRKPQIDKQINLINENIITHNSIIIITGLNSVLGKYGIIKQLSKDNNFVITYH